MKHLSRLLTGLAVVLVVYATMAVAATFSQLADVADRFYSGAGTPVFWCLALVFAGLAAWPLVLFLKLPRMKLPPADKSEPAFSRHQAWLKRHLSNHPDLQVQTLVLRDDLSGALALLDQRADNLVKQTASGVFVSTALIQNGRLDGLVMLAMQVKLIWQLAALYRLRPTPRMLTYLYGNVAGTLLLANQLEELDFAELASPIVASVAPSLAGAVPGMQGIGQLLVNSIANGSANAFLTLRVGLMAKAYCAPQVEPVRSEVRAKATRSALAMLGTITKEQGQRVVKGVWSGVKTSTIDTVGGVVDGTRKAARQAGQSVRDTVTNTAAATAETVSKVADVAKDGATTVVKGTVGAAEVVVKAASETMGKAAENVSAAVKQGAELVGQVGRTTVETTQNMFKRKEADTKPEVDEGRQGRLL